MRALVIAAAVLGVAAAGCGTNDPFARGEALPQQTDKGPVTPGGGNGGGGGGDDGGTGTGGDDGGGVGVSFTNDVDPIFDEHCTGCHAGGLGGLTLIGDPAPDYDNVIERVTPGDPENSLLLHKVIGESHGGGAVLEDGGTEYSVIEAWIAAGAPNN